MKKILLVWCVLLLATANVQAQTIFVPAYDFEQEQTQSDSNDTITNETSDDLNIVNEQDLAASINQLTQFTDELTDVGASIAASNDRFDVMEELIVDYKNVSDEQQNTINVLVEENRRLNRDARREAATLNTKVTALQNDFSKYRAWTAFYFLLGMIAFAFIYWIFDNLRKGKKIYFIIRTIRKFLPYT